MVIFWPRQVDEIKTKVLTARTSELEHNWILCNFLNLRICFGCLRVNIFWRALNFWKLFAAHCLWWCDAQLILLERFCQIRIKRVIRGFVLVRDKEGHVTFGETTPTFARGRFNVWVITGKRMDGFELCFHIGIEERCGY